MLSIGAGFIFFISAMGVQAAEDGIREAPTIRKPPSKTCQCPDARETGIIFLEGLIVDAEVTLGSDRRSINDRQATIVDVVKSDDDVKGRTRVWHTTSEVSCGVTFEYGRTYKIPVRKTEDGAFETDQCLMRQK